MSQSSVFYTWRTLFLSGVLNLVVLCGGGVFARPAVAQNATPQGEAVSGVDFFCSVEAELSRVTCRIKGETTFEGVRQFTLEEPDRLVIDLPGLQVHGPENYSLADSPTIQRIRSGNRGDLARVVLDLKQRVSVSMFLAPDKKTLLFDLSSVEAPPPSLPTVSVPEGEVTEQSPAQDEDLDEAVPESKESASSVEVENQKLSVASTQKPLVGLSIPKGSIKRDDILKFSVDSTFVSIEPGDRSLRDIRVTNKTGEEMFIRTDVQRVYDSGTPDERYESTKVFVATPRRFSLPPMSTRSVRLLLTSEPPSEGEEIYRLILSPEARPDADAEVEGTINDRPATFSVVAALGVTVALPSPEAKGVVRIESQYNQVSLINSGTRAVMVENCSTCPLDTDSCVSSGRKLLYPERPWSLPVKGSGVINCEFSLGKQKQKLSSLFGAKEPK